MTQVHHNILEDITKSQNVSDAKTLFFGYEIKIRGLPHSKKSLTRSR